MVVLALGAATARAQDPEGCFQSASPALSIEAFRMDGQIGLIGNVSECETIAYRVKLAHTAPETGCAIGKGTITLATPDGVPHLVSADVPCIGGHGDNGSGCDPNQGYAFTSGLVPYKVQPRDVVDGFIEASAKYTDGVLFDAKTPTPGVGASTGAKEPVVFCADENLCTSDSCQPTKYGAEACINEPIVCDDGNGCTSDQCNPADGHCVFELAVFCDDGSVCSNDACDPDTGQCVYQPVLANVPCRPSAGICDVAETCTGDSVDCPADGVRDGTFVCRAASGACDVAETCDGALTTCPEDQSTCDATCAGQPEGTACDDGDACTGADACHQEECRNGVECPGIDIPSVTPKPKSPIAVTVQLQDTEGPAKRGLAEAFGIVAGSGAGLSSSLTRVGEGGVPVTRTVSKHLTKRNHFTARLKLRLNNEGRRRLRAAGPDGLPIDVVVRVTDRKLVATTRVERLLRKKPAKRPR